MHPLPRTALHHCWCQTVNLQAQHFTKPLEHQLSLSHATSAPQNSQLSLRGQPLLPFPRRLQPLPEPPGYLFIFGRVRSSTTPPAAGCSGISPGCRWKCEVCHVLGPGGDTGLGKVTQISHPALHPWGQRRERSAWRDKPGEPWAKAPAWGR